MAPNANTKSTSFLSLLSKKDERKENMLKPNRQKNLKMEFINFAPENDDRKEKLYGENKGLIGVIIIGVIIIGVNIYKI